MRDLTIRQYINAAIQQGFKVTPLGLEDISGKTPGVTYGAVFDAQNMKLRRRTSLAEAIRKRKERIQRENQNQ